MKLRINHILFLLLIIGGFHVKAQETAYAIKIDTAVHNKWQPTGIRIGFDIAGPIYNLFEPAISNYEGLADIDFGKFFVVVEMGRGNYQSSNEPTNYSSTGFFYRIGADVNMIAKDSKLNVLYFGLRYATASFKETLKGTLPNSGWGDTPINFAQEGSRANWVEMNIGMRVRVLNSFFTGYTVRFKLLKHSAFSENNFETYFVPGYGVSSNTSNWGISYYIQYRFEWKKKPIKWKEN